eukprot:760312-Hanusia_phi.AAC.2
MQGISLTSLKTCCRRIGILRWPSARGGHQLEFLQDPAGLSSEASQSKAEVLFESVGSVDVERVGIALVERVGIALVERVGCVVVERVGIALVEKSWLVAFMFLFGHLMAGNEIRIATAAADPESSSDPAPAPASLIELHEFCPIEPSWMEWYVCTPLSPLEDNQESSAACEEQSSSLGLAIVVVSGMIMVDGCCLGPK